MNIRTFLVSTLSAILMTASLVAGEIMSDDFSVDKSGRNAGALVDGAALQVGSANWVADPSFVFGDKGHAVLTAEGPAILGIPFHFDEVQDKGDVVTVSAKVLIGGAGWLAISFGSKVALEDFFPTTKFWALLRPDGKWQVRDGFTFDTEPLILAEGEVFLAPDEPVKLSLSYNESAGEVVDFSINGVSVASGITFESVRKWPVAAIVIKALQAKEGLSVDDFKVFVTKAGEPLPTP